MELCTARGISNYLFHKPPPHIAPIHIRCLIQCSTPFPTHLKQTRSTSGPRYTIISCLSSTTEATTYEAVSSDDTTTVTTSPEDTMSEETTPEETVPEIAVTEATSGIREEPESDGAITVEVVDSLPVEKKEDYINQPDVVLQENDSLQLLKFLENLNIKSLENREFQLFQKALARPLPYMFDYEDKYSIVAWGIGGLIFLRIAVAVVGAIDSIPLLPKVLELVGLGYTIWFTTRYLIFEQKREEFVSRVKQFKEEVIG